MLVRFSLTTQDETINCIVSKHELANMLMLPEQTELAVYGHMNKNQLVIDKMLIRKSLIIA